MNMTQPRPSQLLSGPAGWLITALIYGALAWACAMLSRGDGHVAAIWLPNAVVVAAGLIWRPSLPRLVIPGFAACLSALLLAGDPLRGALSFSVANMAEVMLVLAFSRAIITPPARIKEPRNLTLFLAIANLAALCAGMVAALLAAGITEGAVTIGWQWWLADAIAMATIVPILLVVEAEWQACRRRNLPLLTAQAGLDILLGSIALTAIFAQSTLPLLFLAVPVILAVAVRQGSAASALLLLVATLIAVYFTMAGYGPVHLAISSMFLKGAVLQVFILTTFLSTLPITLGRERIEALRERTLTLFETMNETPFSLDLSGRWIDIGRQWTTLAGGRRFLPIGKRALAIVPPAQRRAVLATMKSLLKGEIEEAQFKFCANLPSSEPVHLSVRTRLMRRRDGEPECFVGIITDVSRETARERALADSERRLSSLAENAPVGIFELDNEGNAIFLNKAWARMHGMSIAEGLGKGWQRLLDAEQQARYAAYAQERAAGAGTDVEVAVQRPDGTRCHGRVVSTALLDGDGNVIGRMGVVVDQTREHETKAALMETLEEARMAAAAKDRFLALMSHELRTPMNGVLGFAERLQESALDENQRRYVSLITRSGEVMLALLNDILDTSRMREGQLHLVHKPYDLAGTLTGTCQHFEPLAVRRGLQLRCNFASPLPRAVLGDQQRVTQILTNLLGNALKFTEEGWISVYARVEPQYDRTILIVEVTDTGIGIPADAQESIFEAFDQGGEEISMRFGGTGLGLPIARGLAEQMGGSLRLVTSSVGKGSIFRLTLPLEVPPEAVAPRMVTLDEAATSQARGAAQDLYILVAEDNEINRHLIADLLADSGCKLTIVPDGEQAVEAVRKADSEGRLFDLVLMDLRMPILDGVGATRIIRQSFDAGRLPIVAVTASAHQDAMDACWEAGMQDYVTKPLSRAAIDAVLGKWARGKAKDSATATPEPTAPAASPAIDPALAPLLPRFLEQCSDCLTGVMTALEAWPDTDRDQLRATQSMAHSLAGLAATFAAPELIAPAQTLDMALDETEATAIRQPLLDMQAALKAYLA